MPLIAPALRVLFTFLNVFESFKTLKMPQPSSRNGGKPTVRALSQRKRSMKGCLTVWLVWCCFILYERTLDSIVGMFIPFYNEFKSLVILFLLLTRARSAEPIFLHVLRPMIKPYVATLDAFLYVTHQVGDLVILVVSIPVESVMSRYRYWFGKSIAPSEIPETQTEQKGVPSERPGPRRVDTTEYGATRSRRHVLDNAHAKASSSRPEAPVAVGSSQTRQIWQPPPSAYEREGLPTPPYEESDPTEEQPEVEADLNWRKYEPFPAAYPPTPMTNHVDLPATNHEPMDGIEEEGEPGEVEEWRKYEDFPSAYPATPLPKRKQLPREIPKLGHVQEESEGDETDRRRPGFRRSLKQTHESMNPRHAGSLGDKENKPGARRFMRDSAERDGGMDLDLDAEDEGEDGEEDEDVDMDEEEDSFDVTLRTPFPLSKRENVSHFSTTSNDDGDILTGLSTVDNGSPLRTRVNSEAPPAPLAGTKRPHNGVDGEDLAARVRRLEGMRIAGSKVQHLQVPQANRRIPSQGPIRLRRDSHGSTRDSEVDDDASSSSAHKKRRVGLTRESSSSGREERRRIDTASGPKAVVSGTRIRRTTSTSMSRVSSGSSVSSRTDPETKANLPKIFLKQPIDKPAQKQAPPMRTSRTTKPVKPRSPY